MWPGLARMVATAGRRFYSSPAVPSSQLHFFHPGFPAENVTKFSDSFIVIEDVVNEAEEDAFMKEMEVHLKRHIYEKDHWDDAIKGFRETERKVFNAGNGGYSDKMQQARSYTLLNSEFCNSRLKLERR